MDTGWQASRRPSRDEFRALPPYTVPMFRVLGLLLLAFVVSVEAKEKRLRGKAKKLREAPGSQIAGRDPAATVGEKLRVGAAVFAVSPERGKLRIARDGTAIAFAGNGKTITVGNVALRFVRAKDGTWRSYSARAYHFKIGDVSVRLIDINGDGRYNDFERDGYTAYGSNVVCPLQRELMLGHKRVRFVEIAADGAFVRVDLTKPAGNEQQVEAVVRLNRIRAMHGLAPAMLDAALSENCTAHANYLAVNSWTGGTNPHAQTLGPKGASPGGASAARRSAIVRTNPSTAVDGFWLTYYHSFGLVSAGLTLVGINSEPVGLAVIDCAQGNEQKQKDPWIWKDPVFVPANQSVEFPTNVTSEMPSDPVSDMNQRGHPLMVFFRKYRPGVTDFKCILEAVRGNRRKPVAVLAAAQGGFPSVFGVVPERRLKNKTLHVAHYSWSLNGKRVEHTIRFRTK